MGVAFELIVVLAKLAPTMCSAGSGGIALESKLSALGWKIRTILVNCSESKS